MASPTPHKKLADLLQHPAIWQANEQHSHSQASHSVSSGYPELDSKLHLGGWPCCGSTELFSEQAGIGELSLLMPALNELSQRYGQRCMALISPPHVPNAPAFASLGINLRRFLVIQASNLADKLWVNEQLLRSGHFAAVISWLDDKKLSYAQLRKIQLAGQDGQSWAISFRPNKVSEQSSPAKLRMRLQAKKQHVQLDILKQQGGWAGQQVLLPRPNKLMSNTLHVQDWIPNDHAVVSNTFTLTAAGSIHARRNSNYNKDRSQSMRGYSAATRAIRQRASVELRHSD